MKSLRFLFYIQLAFTFSCSDSLELDQTVMVSEPDDHVYSTKDYNNSETCELLFNFIPTSAGAFQTIRVTWSDQNCSFQAPLEVGIYSLSGQLLKIISNTTSSNKEVYWFVGLNYNEYKNNTSVRIRLVNRITRHVYAISSNISLWTPLSQNCGFMFNGSTTTIQIRNGEIRSFAIPGSCWRNIPYVDLILVDKDTFKRYPLIKNLRNTGSHVELSVPFSIPEGCTYKLAYEMSERHNSHLYASEIEYVTYDVRNPNLAPKVLLCSNNLIPGELTRFHWEKNRYVYHQVSVSLYKGSSKIKNFSKSPSGLAFNTGYIDWYVDQLQNGNDYRIVVSGKYCGTSMISDYFSIFNPGVYESRDSRCDISFL